MSTTATAVDTDRRVMRSAAADPPAPDQPRIAIVCDHASAKFGGEAALPLHYFRVLRRRGFHVWLVTHARTRDELTQLFPEEKRILYIEDALLHRFLHRIGRMLPMQVSYLTVGFILRLATQLSARRCVKRLVHEQGINVVHQPMPVSPREPSMMYGFGVPVIIGPLNGGMDYPPAFSRHRGVGKRWLVSFGRWSSSALNWLVPGKRLAALLLVANKRTLHALPAGLGRPIVEVVENGVDLSTWKPSARARERTGPQPVTTFAFIGRLVSWKAVDLLLHAFKRAAQRVPIRLLVIGDGEERVRLEPLAVELGIDSSAPDRVGCVFFSGWLSQEACAYELRQSDCLVLPSLYECGGAVVLEAMSTGKPVIATAWGGPTDYIDDTCGILVPPTDRESLVQGIADAMVRIASSAARRLEMGKNGRDKIVRHYDWEVKVDRILELYEMARLTMKPNPARDPH